MTYWIAALSPSHVFRPFDMEDFLAPGSKPEYFPLKYVTGWQRQAERRLKARPDLAGSKVVICLETAKNTL